MKKYSPPLSKQFRILEEIVQLLSEYFEGDSDKVKLWMETENVQFGGISPLSMIAAMRGDNVLKFIKHAKEENGWHLR